MMHRQQGREGQLPTLREATGICGAGVDRAELGRRAVAMAKEESARKDSGVISEQKPQGRAG